jgi:hypothetical protein
MTNCESAVLQAILAKANIYGKHAKASIACLMAITGYQERSVQYATKGLRLKGLLHVDKRWRWPGMHHINVYHVVVPWRFDPLAHPSALPYWTKGTRPQFKGAKPVHPNPQREKTLAAPTQKEGEEEKSARTIPEIRDEIRHQELFLQTIGTPGSVAYAQAQNRLDYLKGLLRGGGAQKITLLP